MGTGSVSCTLPEVIEVCDSDDINIIRIGTSGGLQPYLKIGDFVISTEIISQETASHRPIDLVRYLGTLYKQGGQSPNEKVERFMKRIRDLYGTSDAVTTKIAEVFDYEGVGMHNGYSPTTDINVSVEISQSAKKHMLSGQKLHVGPTNTTAEIYANSILGSVTDHKDQLAVSMEMSMICSLRDFYNVVDGRNIKAGKLLMISDLVVGEADNWPDYLSRKDQFEKAHILTGLDALVSLRKG